MRVREFRTRISFVRICESRPQILHRMRLPRLCSADITKSHTICQYFWKLRHNNMTMTNSDVQPYVYGRIQCFEVPLNQQVTS